MINYLKRRIERRFNRIVHQAIIDGIRLYRTHTLYGLDRPKDESEKDQERMALVTGWLVYLAIIFIIAAKAIGGAP